MNKKYLIYLGIGMVLIIGIIMLTSAEKTSSWCYQETANVSTACGGLNTGTYLDNFESINWYDGEWITYISDDGSSELYSYINYTKPNGAEQSSLWKTKIGDATEVNLTILETCWNYNETNLQLRLQSNRDGSGVYCNNGTWNILDYDFNGVIYEEAMWWNVTTEEPDAPSSQIKVAGTNNHLKLSGTNNRLNIRNQT
jgi:hypothetical protein